MITSIFKKHETNIRKSVHSNLEIKPLDNIAINRQNRKAYVLDLLNVSQEPLIAPQIMVTETSTESYKSIKAG